MTRSGSSVGRALAAKKREVTGSTPVPTTEYASDQGIRLFAQHGAAQQQQGIVTARHAGDDAARPRPG